DRKLVQLLAADGRMSYTDLGKATGLSTSAVHQRVRRLEERGVVQGYQAIIDPAQVGLPLTAYISLSPLDPAAPDDIPDRIRSFPEIESCHSVAGDFNYITKVRVATPLDLEDLLTRLRGAAHVQTRTTVVLSTAWEGRPVTGKEAREPKESPKS
ncbi:MAG TPA: Lrp/AsnC family transcriptional regulator, partial [Dermatophilaceae bacterium]|nr:Lrp/AsnC family transcriptional regulator [Dermatophilaceae bacterium]